MWSIRRTNIYLEEEQMASLDRLAEQEVAVLMLWSHNTPLCLWWPPPSWPYGHSAPGILTGSLTGISKVGKFVL